MSDIAAIKAILSQPKRITITTHQNPDGDAIGSSLALYHYLHHLGHQVQVITPNEHPPYLHWLPGHEHIWAFNRNKEEAKKWVAASDLIFCLDFNDLRRIADLGNHVKKTAVPKILIDHHLQPTDFADFEFCEVEASSTAELVFDFLQEVGGKEVLNTDIATCIYTGVMTDTGGFQFPSTTSKVHRMVADLLDCGVENFRAFDMVYNQYTEDRLRFIGHCFSNRLKVYPNYRAALIYVTKEDQERFNVQKGDTEGLVNAPLQIMGIRFSALFIEREDIVKVSLRSKGNFDVNVLARALFNGGGHKNAAGGSSDQSLNDTISRFENALPEYEQELIDTL